tara:strand:- start:14027 stop:14257 length:231 start_codon:yes stop_codon:yes gene_type:complete
MVNLKSRKIKKCKKKVVILSKAPDNELTLHDSYYVTLSPSIKLVLSLSQFSGQTLPKGLAILINHSCVIHHKKVGF